MLFEVAHMASTAISHMQLVFEKDSVYSLASLSEPLQTFAHMAT